MRDQTDTEDICELLAHWDYINLLSYSGLVFEENVTEFKVTTKAYLAYIPYLRTMAEESSRMISQALERLTVNQTTTTWSRHVGWKLLLHHLRTHALRPFRTRSRWTRTAATARRWSFPQQIAHWVSKASDRARVAGCISFNRRCQASNPFSSFIWRSSLTGLPIK